MAFVVNQAGDSLADEQQRLSQIAQVSGNVIRETFNEVLDAYMRED